MTDVRLAVRQVAERTQRDNWTGYALFLQVRVEDLWPEIRLTEPERATSNVGLRMAEGTGWARDHGYWSKTGWIAGDDGLVVLPIEKRDAP